MELNNQTINFYSKHPKIWKLDHNRQIEIYHKTLIMEIINVTLDSFSDGNQHLLLKKAVNQMLFVVSKKVLISLILEENLLVQDQLQLLL